MQNGNLVIRPNSGILNNFQSPKPSFPSNGVFDWQNQNASSTTGMGLLKKNLGTAANQAANVGGFLSKIFSPNSAGSGALGNVSQMVNAPQASSIVPTANAQTNVPTNAGAPRPIQQPARTSNVSSPLPPATNAAPQPIPGYVPGVGNVSDITKYGTAGVPMTASSQNPIDLGAATQRLNESMNGNPNGVPGLFPRVTSNLANTQPATGAQNAVTSLQGQAEGQNPAATNIGNLTSIGQNESPTVQQARANLAGLIQAQANIANNPNVAANVASGRGQAFAGEIQAAEANLNAALQGEQQQISAANAAAGQQLTGQGQQINAATNAGNVSNTAQGNQITGQIAAQGAAKPQLGAYGQTYYNPLNTGQNGSGNLDPQTQASNLAQSVINGKMSYADAVSSMGYAGNAGQQFLNTAIQQINPNFNFQQAQTLSQQQGTVVPAYNFASQSLQNVENLMNQLPSAQNTNVPAINALTRGFSTVTGIGSEQTRAVTGAVQTLRNAYANLLASVKGGTPTDYSSQATAEIPDMPTANDIAALRKNFETLGGARVSVYGSPGTASMNSGNQSQFVGSAWE